MAKDMDSDMEEEDKEEDMEKITIRLPPGFIKQMDYLIKTEDYSSRSELIRTAIRDFLYQRVEFVAEKRRKMREAELEMQRLDEEVKRERRMLKKKK